MSRSHRTLSRAIPEPRRVALAGMLAAALLAGCQGGAVRTMPEPADDPDRLADLHTQLGIGYMQEGKYDLAWKRLHRALEVDPNFSTAHNAMGLLSETLGEHAQAEHHYQRAVDIDPSDSAAQTNFGSFLCRQGRHEAGEERFLRAVKNPLYKNPEVAYTNAGLCMERTGDPEKAERYLRRALDINPRIPAALLSMSAITLESGRELSARAYLQRYQEVAESTPRSLWLGIRIERVLGDQNAVSSYAMLLKAKYPDSREAQLLLESERE